MKFSNLKMDNNDVISFKRRKKKFTGNRISSMIFSRTEIKDTEIPLKRSGSKTEKLLTFDPNLLSNVPKDSALKKERSQSRILLDSIFKRTKDKDMKASKGRSFASLTEACTVSADSVDNINCEITTDVLDLEVALKGQDFFGAFMEFSRLEHSEENLEFYDAVQKFKKIDKTDFLASEANRIIGQYISENCDKPINIDSNARHLVNQGQANPTAKMFDACQEQIYNLMKGDCFPRFLQSRFYKSSIKSLPSLSKRNKLLIPMIDNKKDLPEVSSSKYFKTKSSNFLNASDHYDKTTHETPDGKRKLIIIPLFDEKFLREKPYFKPNSIRLIFNDRCYLLSSKDGLTLESLVAILNIPHRDLVSYYAFLLPHQQIIDLSQNSIYFSNKTIEFKRFSLLHINLGEQMVAVKCSIETTVQVVIDSVLSFYNLTSDDVISTKLRNKKTLVFSENCGKYDRFVILCKLKDKKNKT